MFDVQNELTNSPFLLGDDMGYVHPSTKHQYGSFEADKILTNAIAMAVSQELAFDDLVRQGKFDWLPEVHRKIRESWDWVESCVLDARELCPAKVENIA